MTQDLWSSVDDYITETLFGEDAILDQALEASDAAGLPSIQVSPAQGRLLEIIARIHGARTILEIGTLGGYSTIWLARALPAEGTLVTLEIDPKHAEVAASNIERAGLGEKVEVRTGDAREILPRLVDEGYGPFDLFFIDADKASIPVYFEWAMSLSRPGSLIIVDNVVREGAVIDAESDDPSVRGVRTLNEMMARDDRVTATVVQTVGSKGYDGFAAVLVMR